MTKKRLIELRNLDISKGFIIDKYNDKELYTDVKKSMSLKETLKLRKSKYIKRWKGKDGKWHYEYVKIKSSTKENRNKLIDAFNKIVDKYKTKGSTLADLTDKELFIFIAGKGLDYGNSVEQSLSNAKIHMEDRKKAERLFGTKVSEDLLTGSK